MLRELTIYLNNKCNLACKYCYVRKGSKELPFSKFKRIFDFFLQQSPFLYQKRVFF